MPTYSKQNTNSPWAANFSTGLSGTATGTFNQAFAVVPAGQALVVTQIFTGTNTTVNQIDGPSSLIYKVPVSASSILDVHETVLGPGSYTLNVTLSGSYSWSATGYYVSINT